VVLVVGVFLVGPAVVAGQAGAATTTPTTTPTSTNLTSDHAYTATIWALVFGFLAIVAVLAFLYFDRRRSFALVRTAARKNRQVKPEEEHALQTAMALRGGAGIEIVGTTDIEVGAPTTYKTKSGDDVSWSVTGQLAFHDPAAAGTASSSVRIVGQAAGSGVLSATAQIAGRTESASHDITVTSDPRQDTTAGLAVPFLGMGYGSVIISLAVASVTAALGIAGVLNGQAVATILGSLVTYSVVKGATSTTSTTPSAKATAD